MRMSHETITDRDVMLISHVDGAAIGALTAVPIAIASASTPMGLVSGLLTGGSYFVAHDAMCNARN